MWLILMTPAADELVGSWRAEHDWSARHGIRAHVTVRTPFLPPERWGDPAIADVLTPFLPQEVTLARVEDRPGALVVVAEPDDALRELTAATNTAWPDLPPHKGQWPTFAYHVTVVRTPDAAVRARAREALERELPLRVTGTAFRASAPTADGGLIHRELIGGERLVRRFRP